MTLSLRSCCGAVFGLTFVYNTPKILSVRSIRIGLVNRLVQIIIVSYVIGYAIVYKKGYQDTDVAYGSVTTKVKGIASTLGEKNLPPEYRRIWDTPEFVPTHENGAFFVLTNAIITPNQKLGLCAEDPSIRPCDVFNTANSCTADTTAENGNGVMTGFCIPSSTHDNRTSCEIMGWCPLERKKLLLSDRPLLSQAVNFTVFIKNNIEFPKFGIKLSNIQFEHNNEHYLKTCRNNPHNNKYCPVFRIGDIIHQADRSRSYRSFEDIATLGGVVNIAIKWDCNLDRDYEKCLPIYEFSRLDHPTVPTSPGYNFRYAKYFQLPNKTEGRHLIKAYGILFIITVEGRAGKFSIIPLAFNIGAGIGLFGLATIVTDMILLYLSSEKKTYSERKFSQIDGMKFSKVKSKITKKPLKEPEAKEKQDGLLEGSKDQKAVPKEIP